MKLYEIVEVLESFAPLVFQEGYDNAGLSCGDLNDYIHAVLVCLDVTEEVLEEAIREGSNLVISHHPLLFKPIKRLTGVHYSERILLKAIRNNIALYSAHTNLDNVFGGVNFKIAEKIGLDNVQILEPKENSLQKLVVFVPLDHTDTLLKALGEAGAGQIGNYKNCSFRTEGIGSFIPNGHAKPFLGKQHLQEEVLENRVEVVFPIHKTQSVLSSMRKVHPYEEVAYFIQNVQNSNQELGAGAIGFLKQEMKPSQFLAHMKNALGLHLIKYTHFDRAIRKVAICGGSGSFMLGTAVAAGADVFVSADFKYHEYFEADGRIMVADVGHYESEKSTKELFVTILSEKLPNLKVKLCQTDTNPVSYFM